MQFPSGAMAIRLAAFAGTLGESAAKKPLAGGELSNAGAEVALGGGKFGAVRGRPYLIHILYKIEGKVKSKNTMRICSLIKPRLKHQWNQKFGRLKISVAEPLLTPRVIAVADVWLEGVD